MIQYPDGTRRVCPPAKVTYKGQVVPFGRLTADQREELGYLTVVLATRKPFYVYETREEQVGAEIREIIVSETLDTEAYETHLAATKREERNRRLLESDPTQLNDASQRFTDEELAEWATYRQELRELPEKDDWPYSDMPVAPASAERL
jgi:hypothetical protein